MRKILTCPELPKQFSTIAIRRAFASLLTAIKEQFNTPERQKNINFDNFKEKIMSNCRIES